MTGPGGGGRDPDRDVGGAASTTAAPDDSAVTVRPAAPDEQPVVAGVLDAALLSTPNLGAALDRGDVLVAAVDDRVLGALVLEPRESGAHVAAVAVRRGRRGQGIGSALVAAAAERAARLTAECRPGLRSFYEALGFDVQERPNGRLRCVLAG